MVSTNVANAYYIQSKLNNFVLDLKDSATKANTGLVVSPLNNDSTTQLWSFDEDGTITNVATGLVIDISGGIKGTNLIIYNKKNDKSRDNQIWKWDSPYIVCEPAHKVIDIEGINKAAGAKVIAHSKNGGVNQQWQLVPKVKLVEIFYHGDPRRDNNFWVYPHDKSLITPQWDTHDPYSLCDHFTALDVSGNELRRYKCQGHEHALTSPNFAYSGIHIKGKHWLNSSYTGINLLETNGSSSTLWHVHIHSIQPFIVSLRCHDLTGTKQQWLTRTNDNQIRLGDSENTDGARWNVYFVDQQSTCLLSNKLSGSEPMYLDGYTTDGTLGLVSAPYNQSNVYTGAYWKVITRK